uniref:Uncharacterized protein n=1 Tax=Caenorhabditis japonica TaxID=281687 RepID=A0A8R1ITD3_CAEJA
MNGPRRDENYDDYPPDVNAAQDANAAQPAPPVEEQSRKPHRELVRIVDNMIAAREAMNRRE